MTPSRLFGHYFVFAQILRGVSALIVLLGAHVAGDFWLNPPIACSLLRLQECYSPVIPKWITFIHDTGFFRYNHFGVALFFLISGFVIPYSLHRYSVKSFLLLRFCRIYPMYWVALAISVLSLYLFHGRQFVIGGADILVQMTLMRDLFWTQSLDGISWTLEVEVKFYLFCALCAGLIDEAKLKKLVIIFFFLMAASLLCSNSQRAAITSLGALQLSAPWYGLAHALALFFMYLSFMFIGTVYNWHQRSLLTKRAFICAQLLLFSGFMILWSQSELRAEFLEGCTSYFLALLVFALCYAYRNNFPSIPALIWLGNISYPLYAVHSVVSYTVLYWLVFVRHVMPSLAITVVVLVAFTLALILHKFVELPSNNFGKKWALRMEQGKRI